MERKDGVVWTGLIWLRTGPVEGCFEHGKDLRAPSDVEKLFELLQNQQLLKKGSPP
jgi:hypothetical protein